MKFYLVGCTVLGTKLPLFVTVTSNACMENHQNPLFLHRVTLKGDSKVAPVHAMKAFTRSGGIAPPILNLGTRWSPVINFMPRPLHPRERTPGTHWMRGPPQLVWTLWRKDRSLAPASNQTPDLPPSSLVTTVTMHLWFLDVFKPFRILEVLVLQIKYILIYTQAGTLL
jgi:hypothetical protein